MRKISRRRPRSEDGANLDPAAFYAVLKMLHRTRFPREPGFDFMEQLVFPNEH